MRTSRLDIEHAFAFCHGIFEIAATAMKPQILFRLQIQHIKTGVSGYERDPSQNRSVSV